MKKLPSINEIAMNSRRTWGEFKPIQKTFKTKKDYNRKDKSWKKDF